VSWTRSHKGNGTGDKRRRFPIFQYELGGTWADSRRTGPWTQFSLAFYLELLGYDIYIMGVIEGVGVHRQEGVPAEDGGQSSGVPFAHVPLCGAGGPEQGRRDNGAGYHGHALLRRHGGQDFDVTYLMHVRPLLGHAVR